MNVIKPILSIVSLLFATVVLGQNIDQYELTVGEVYVHKNGLSNSTLLFKVESITYNCIYVSGKPHYHGHVISNEKAFGSSYVCSVDLKYLLRKADSDERAWLQECIRQNKLVDRKEFMKNRGAVISEKITLNRNSLYPKVEGEGWQFTSVPFRYQFVNCGGEVQVGVQYDRQASNISLLHNGVTYYNSKTPELWPTSSQIEVGSVFAKLYYGVRYLGEVRLTYIVGNFAGCFGETFDVLKQVGKDPTDKEYRDNLGLFSLKNIVITSGGVTIGYNKEHQIIRELTYDDFGNPLKPGTSPSKPQGDKPKYDIFGNPIKD